MKSFLKGAAVAGTLAFSLTFAAQEAEAEPVVSSWYGPGFEGSPTASGEIFDPAGHTAAHRTLPLGTEATVCYNGCVDVVINDRGPYANGADLDLSQGAAEAVGLTGVGVDTVDMQVGGSEAAAEPQVEPVSTGASFEGGEAYTVQDGDTLSGIAAEFGVSVDELAAANSIADPSLILPGQELSVPGSVAV
ncbi:MAG: septal ring lytic transglycosylase RlpA family protein [Rubrobacter sp.]|nr:septal ring lytic transglycosylase RlpA family protein [Rubrobacter sp.]